jgi:hypothetical protein
MHKVHQCVIPFSDDTSLPTCLQKDAHLYSILRIVVSTDAVQAAKIIRDAHHCNGNHNCVCTEVQWSRLSSRDNDKPPVPLPSADDTVEHL